MGAQIAAHLVNAGVPALLFDLATASDPNALARRGIDALAKLEPAPLGRRDLAAQIDAANYDSDLPRLADCDLVIEAIGERIDWKRDLYAKIAPHVAPSAALVSNTSGLSLAQLSAALPAALRPRFCGVHFFNPPRYMRLVELVATADTDRDLLDALEAWLTTALGKGVVRAMDTPNFIANRIGIFSVLATMHHGDALGLRYDEVDALTGTVIGRAKSATYRTADVVGLDTMAHVVKTMQDALPDDPWRSLFALPASLAGLVAKGALGQKTKAGYYRKVGRDIEVLDPASGAYVKSGAEVAPEVAAILALTVPRTSDTQGCANRSTRRRSSCGRSTATSSTMRRITWRPSPTTRATSTSPSAGVSGGGRVRSSSGSRPAGAMSPHGSNPIARRDERWPTSRCRRGSAPDASSKPAACMRGTAPGARRATRSSRVPPCRSIAGSRTPTRCWASGRTAARRSSRPTHCGCGTAATTSASCRSGPR